MKEIYLEITKKYKRILLTGGAGFIGSCLVRRLLKNTSSKIFNLDFLGYSSDLSSIQNLTQSKNKNRYLHLKNDLRNFEEIKQTIREVDPDIIIHLAAESHVDRSINNPSDFIESNIIGTYNLLEAARKHFENLSLDRKEVFIFQHISTDEVYGTLGDSGKFSENTAYDPRSPYSASKASSDHLVNAWFHTFNLPILITNCSNNYGPYQFPEKLIPLMVMKALKGEKLPIYGDGKNIRDWIFVEDHIDGLLYVMNKGKIGNKYCLGGNSERNNKDVVENICDILDQNYPQDKSYKNLIEFVLDRPGHDRRYAIDSTKVKQELKWFPKNDFNTGLKKTVIWYANNQEWCKKVMDKSGYVGNRIGLKN